jgi:excisionase family DNA binding protein
MSLDAFIAELLNRIADVVRLAVREELRCQAQQAPGESLPLAVGVGEAARLLGTPVSTVLEWIKSGDLAATKTPGGRTYLVRRAAIEEFLMKKSQPARDKPDDVDEQVARVVASLPTTKR